MGAAFQRGLLTTLTVGHASPRAALTALGGEGEDVGKQDAASRALTGRLQAFADGARDDFLDVPLDLSQLTEFQRAVVEQCRRIPFGEVLTYGQLAAKAGYPGAARAVGNVMAANRFPLIVPCHRVIGAGGSLGGYSGPAGLRRKRQLLEREGSLARAPKAVRTS
jgi:methylated-DNA-[protein]-cysteine S-methyltransferase